MRKLNHDLRLIGLRNRDGGMSTQSDRSRMLSMMANQLHDMGYRNLNATNLKQKHVQALLQSWRATKLSVRTIKNRASALRWWAEKIGKPNLLPRDNASLGVETRVYASNVSKAKELQGGQLDQIKSPFMTMSLRLGAAFGLRREESLKLNPTWADGGSVLRLKSSWTKGGRPREVPITHAEQRLLLDQAKALTQGLSLIPPHLSYRQHLQAFRAACQHAGINGVHGLRHRYAQRRYEEKTGWKAPAAGGPTRKQLSGEQRSVDARARLEISLELGHARVGIVACYLGS